MAASDFGRASKFGMARKAFLMVLKNPAHMENHMEKIFMKNIVTSIIISTALFSSIIVNPPQSSAQAVDPGETETAASTSILADTVTSTPLLASNSTGTAAIKENATSTIGTSTLEATSTSATPETASTTPEAATNTSTTPSSTETTIVPDPISIRLQIESATSTLFNNTLNVTPCSSTSSTPATINAYCAIIQSGLESSWSSFGADYFVNSIAGISNDFANNLYWLWFGNLEYGQTSLNAHLLEPNETVLTTLGRMPLKIAVSTTTPALNSTTTISVLEFGFDASFNGVWLPSASSSILIGDILFETDASGTYSFSPTTTTPLDIWALKNGFLNSPPLAITPVLSETATTTETQSASTSVETINTANSGNGGGIPIAHYNIDTNKALQFLADHQTPDGKIISSLYTDWAAIAFASGPASSAKDKIKNYLKSANDELANVDSAGPLRATDYERRAMALMALEINPYNGTPINYIDKIINFSDNNQIGDPALVNDDIFAIFPLRKSGYTGNDSIIQKITAFILEKQRPDGSWEESVDLTAAGIQALSLVSDIENTAGALANARAYLKNNQKDDGGFGTSFSTSWVLQAIAATAESGGDWVKNGRNPYDYLYSLQREDGGIESPSSDLNARIWATSYAIPAVQNKPWEEILVSFPKPAEPVTAVSIMGSGSVSQENRTPSPMSSDPLAVSPVKTEPSDEPLIKPQDEQKNDLSDKKPGENQIKKETFLLPRNVTPKIETKYEINKSPEEHLNSSAPVPNPPQIQAAKPESAVATGPKSAPSKLANIFSSLNTAFIGFTIGIVGLLLLGFILII